MGQREKSRGDLNEAMRQKDKQRKTTIRLIISAMNKAESELDADAKLVNQVVRELLSE